MDRIIELPDYEDIYDWVTRDQYPDDYSPPTSQDVADAYLEGYRDALEAAGVKYKLGS